MDVDQVRRLVLAQEMLIPEQEISIVDAREVRPAELIQLYQGAFERGDWFGSTCESTDLRHVAAEFVHNHCANDQTLFFAFVDRTHGVVGAAALRLTDSGLLLDEAQIDPRGRRRGIISAYSRRLLPVLDLFGRYWTEFLLTPGTRVLRKLLITELGMVVTGLKPDYYLSRTTGSRYSILVAYGPQATVTDILEGAQTEASAELLDIIRGRSSTLTVARRGHDSPRYEEVTIQWGDIQRFDRYRAQGFLPIECNPFGRSATLAKFPTDRLAALQFLTHEGIETASRLLAYCRR
jgi:hypothetical protein